MADVLTFCLTTPFLHSDKSIFNSINVFELEFFDEYALLFLLRT